ncbi:MAG TPA: shikimate dehydrogenase [Casimicrobiaceae bacterium]|nr:shikimate dehydrogenase [Casimicrobiaceae bacterium]
MIDGATRLYCIIGDPIAQVRSPEVFTQRFVAAGINAALLPVHVPVDAFDRIVPGLLDVGNLDGVLVTVPFKRRMLPFASRVGRTASVIGAVNALRREADGSWSGDMFDGIGFVNAARQKAPLPGRRVLMFGAGGAGSAIACALAEAGVASIDMIDPDAGRAEVLATRLHKAFPACRFTPVRRAEGDFDLVVNASPVGMALEDGLPGEIPDLRRETLVGDVVVRETPSALICHAMDQGCACVTGRDMHAGQVDAILQFFADRPA